MEIRRKGTQEQPAFSNEKDEVLSIPALNSVDWTFTVPESGQVPDIVFDLVFESKFPERRAGFMDAVFFPVRWNMTDPHGSGEESQISGSATFGMRTDKATAGNACLHIVPGPGRKFGVGLRASCMEDPSQGTIVR